ncbi:MAG TPA: chaperone modulator CbpM [Flavisolibacter sp.]|nr:chaperone modulator CbpM [Flavisolibacter sp.]
MKDLVSASAFCSHHQIEMSFIHSLQDHGLIDTTATEQDIFLQTHQLQELEQLMRLHFDLHINLEGIDAVMQLLKRLEKLQEEIGALRNRLQVYESNPQTTVDS